MIQLVHTHGLWYVHFTLKFIIIFTLNLIRKECNIFTSLHDIMYQNHLPLDTKNKKAFKKDDTSVYTGFKFLY